MKNKKSNPEWANIELKHIQLELQHNRFQHLRHFVDQYYCYKNGLVNSNGGAKWESAVWNGIVSVAASKLNDRKDVVKEHVVPLKVITEFLGKLAAEGNVHIDSIAGVLDKYTVFATITKGEDATLREAKLTYKMPDEFYEPENELYDDVLARYKSVGIVLK